MHLSITDVILLVCLFCAGVLVVSIAYFAYLIFSLQSIEYQTCKELLSFLQSDNTHSYFSTKAWIAQECWK